MSDETAVPDLLLDRFLPRYDALIRAHQVAEAEPATTWSALREFDLLRVRSPLVSAAMAARGLPERISVLLGRAPRPPPVERLTFDDGLPGWVILGEAEGRELAFGAVGVFWTPSITWEDVPAEEFADFWNPGYGKIAASLSVQPYGGRRAIVTYETRTATTDPESRARFRRYWAGVRPFVGHVLRATVATIAREAEARQAASRH